MAIFILSPPRNGSTVFFQYLTTYTDVAYVPNIANQIFRPGQVGICRSLIYATLMKKLYFEPHSFENFYGKTKGFFGVSEGSKILSYFFQNGHPSELNAADFVDLAKAKAFSDLTEDFYTGNQIVIKNAWNCFRIKAIDNNIADTKFIILYRDIVRAAASDYRSRLVHYGDATKGWNSATPRNYNDLKHQNGEIQVLENQYEFRRAISEAISNVDENKYRIVHFEDFLDHPEKVISELSKFLKCRVLMKEKLAVVGSKMDDNIFKKIKKIHSKRLASK